MGVTGGAESHIDRLVGRAKELQQLEAVFESGRRGRSRLVVVAGEAGIGKTRFCDEAARRAAESGYAVAWGDCWAEGGAPPLWPWPVLLAEACGADSATLLDGDPGITGVDAERFSRFTAIAEQLRQACGSQPTLLVIDDIHAAGSGSLLLLRFVTRTVRGVSLVVVATRRPVAPDDPNADVLSRIEDEAMLLTLRRFDVHDTTEFLQAANQSPPDPQHVLAALRVTGGIPLLLRRVVALGADEPLAASLPAGVRGLIDMAAARLPDEQRVILGVSAVLGTSPSVRSAAALMRTSIDVVLAAVEAGESAGLVILEDVDQFRFGHELIRDEMEAQLSPAELLDAHARAVALVAGSARRAHHALHASLRSPADAAAAVTACRDAAAEMITGFAYEQAAALLADAAAAHERGGLGPLPATLLVEWAQAVLLTGRLGESRALFDRAAIAAEAECEPVLLATAAVGLGGVWLGERRTPIELARVRGLQERALHALPGSEAALRCRLVVRLAAERAYPGGPYDELFAAIEGARRLGDDAVLAEALSLAHHALLAPERLGTRLEIADELIRIAATAGEGVLSLLGLCWRAIDLSHASDPGAARALAELRLRADALQCQGILYVAQVMDVAQLVRDGRLDEAEAAASACYEFGVAVGDADALGYLGGQLVSIRWMQGRDAEMLEMIEAIADSPTLVKTDFAFQAAVACLAARCGQADKAKATIARLAEGGLDKLRRSSTWLAGMVALVEAVRVVGDAAVARDAHALMLPFADQAVMPSFAVTCFGSGERALGVAALTFGDLDAAVGHLERAVAANTALGNRPLTAISRADLAEALAARGRDGDASRRADLLRTAVADARTMDMDARVEAWQPLLEAAGAKPPEAEGEGAGAGADGRGTMRRIGSRWVVELGGARVVVPDLVGMGYLARLVAQPGVPLSALELASYAADGSGLDAPSQPVLDQQARDAYERRARELAAGVASASADGDFDLAERMSEELDALVDELEAATGIGAHTRAFATPGERARTAVRKAIKRAIDEIEASDASLGSHLRFSVSTGTVCSYQPGA